MQVKLAPKDRMRFLILKKEIKDGLATCFKVGAALKEIRDRELFIEDYDSFEEFCSETYMIGKSHAYRLMDAADVKESVKGYPVAKKLTNERQARALSDVPESKRLKVLTVADKDGDVSADGIAKAAEKVLVDDKPVQKEKPADVVRDLTGFPVPKQAQPLLERDSEVLNMMGQISKIKGIIERAAADRDPLFRLVNHAALIADLSKCYTALGEARPYAVCPTCAGRPDLQPKGLCASCQGRGWLSKFRWTTTVPREFKELRRKSYAK